MEKTYKLPSEAYAVLKWLGLIACPAVAAFLGAVGPVLGLPHVDAVVTTVNAFGVLVGALVGYSAATARPSDGGGA